MCTFMVSIIHNMSSAILKQWLAGGVLDWNYNHYGNPCKYGHKNSLNPEIKIQHQPVPTGSLSWQIQAPQKTLIYNALMLFT